MDVLARPLVIYHAGCYDGFSAAWVANSVLLNAELFPATYGDDPPNVEGRNVYILDFSYPRDVMIEMNRKAQFMRVLDHHKTAEEACAGLDFCEFDIERSGCRMAWDYFQVGEPPRWLLCVEDRDLWRFQRKGTKEVHAFISALHMTIDSWNALSKLDFKHVVDRGAAIEQYISTWIDKWSEQTRFTAFSGSLVATINAPYLNCSELLHSILENHPEVAFAVSYYKRVDGFWVYSLRSRPGFDVSEVAKNYGGGGHAQAAGFTSKYLLV